MTCAYFGRDQICTQVTASFPPFGHPIQINASRGTSIYLLLAKEIEDNLPKNIFCNFRVRLATQRKSLRVHLRLLVGPFGQGFKKLWSSVVKKQATRQNKVLTTFRLGFSYLSLKPGNGTVIYESKCHCKKNPETWNWQFSVSSNTGKFKFGKTHRSKCGCMVASCSSTNQIRRIESFMPTLPDSIGLLNKELRKPWPIKLT